MNYSVFYSQNFRKPVRVKLSNGKEFFGALDGYLLEEDNEPYGESIIIETNSCPARAGIRGSGGAGGVSMSAPHHQRETLRSVDLVIQ